MLRLATDLPAMLDAFTPHSIPCTRTCALALRCTEATCEARPLMTDVVAGLESLLAATQGPLGVPPDRPLPRSGHCWICAEAPRDTGVPAVRPHARVLALRPGAPAAQQHVPHLQAAGGGGRPHPCREGQHLRAL